MPEKNQTSEESDSATTSEYEIGNPNRSDTVMPVTHHSPLADPWQFPVYLAELAKMASIS